MHSRFNVFAAAACAVAILAAPAGARAEGYQLSGPLVRDNLSVYYVHGNSSGGPVPLTLEQAQAQGAIKIHESETHPVKVENLSDRSVFIQLGDLVTGGMQDQVAGTSVLLPPHSGLTPLVTFCVDPFRSSARVGDDPKLFSALGALFPSRMARLSILSGAPDSQAAAKIREQAVWWSVDSLRAQLSQKLGEPLETPRNVQWTLKDDSRANAILAARRGTWTTSLPLAMESPALAQAQQPFMETFNREAQADDIVGAVFAIDGKVVGAEIYQSHALFAAMWAKVLRAYATEALAATNSDAVPPTKENVSAFLAAAEQGEARERRLGKHARLRNSATALYVETAEQAHRSFVAKLDPAALPAAPEALLVQMLETGEAAGRSLASLGERESIVVGHDADASGWTATPQLTPDNSALALLQRQALERLHAGPGLGLGGTLAQCLVLLFFALLAWRTLLKPAILGSVRLVARTFRLAVQATREAAALLAIAAVALVYAVAQLCRMARHTLRSAAARGVMSRPQRAYATVRPMPRLRRAAVS